MRHRRHITGTYFAAILPYLYREVTRIFAKAQTNEELTAAIITRRFSDNATDECAENQSNGSGSQYLEDSDLRH